MRLNATCLGLSFALTLSAKMVSATPILPGNCSSTPSLCSAVVKASGQLTVAASPSRSPGEEYQTPAGGLSSDSHTVSAVEGPFSGTTSGNFSVGFPGVHTVLSAQADAGPRGTGAPGDPIIVGGVSGSAETFAEIEDSFAIASTVPSGTELSITYTIDATGTTGHIVNGSYVSQLFVNFFSNFSNGSRTCTNGSFVPSLNGSYETSCTVLIPISASQPASIDFQFDASAAASNGRALLDAANTAKIVSVLVVDSNGNPLPSVQLFDASGFDYNASTTQPSTVPEPSGIWLLATGLLAIAGGIRREWSNAKGDSTPSFPGCDGAAYVPHHLV